MTKPAIYPNVTLRNAAASFPPPARQMNLSAPRNAQERWAGDVLKHRKLLAWAVRYKPAICREWTENLRTALRMAEIEAEWYPLAGWRE